MAVSGTGKCLDWQYPVLLLVLDIHSVDFSSFQCHAAQPFQAGFWAFLMP